MIYILVFNYNYRQFLDALFKSLECLVNNEKYTVIINDDYSTDDSVEKIEQFISRSKAQNFLLHVRKIGETERVASHGQLLGVLYLLENFSVGVADKVVLLDSDDVLPSEYYTNIENYLDYDVVFPVTFNVLNSSKKTLEYRLKRRIDNCRYYIWPTIVPTSGLLISGSLLQDCRNIILDFSEEYRDVWLDCRINMLAMLDSVKFVYADDLPAFRLIHNNNDSGNMNKMRLIYRHLATYRFMRKYVPLNRRKLGIRFYIYSLFK